MGRAQVSGCDPLNQSSVTRWSTISKGTEARQVILRSLYSVHYRMAHKHYKYNRCDALSQVTTRLDPDTVRSILDGVTLGTMHQAEVHDPAIVQGNCHLDHEVHVAAGCTLLQMHFTDWAKAQKDDLMPSPVLGWLKAQKKTDLKALLAEHTSSEDGRLILQNWQNFMIHQGALYLHSTPKGETRDLLLFVVPRAQHVATWNEYHRDAVHQGCDCTLSLLWEHFWWPGMANQMWQSIRSCIHCLQHEGAMSKAPLYPIVATAPMDLLHVDFTSIETTLELNRPPKVDNVLVFQDHFTKHIMAYVTPIRQQKQLPSSCIRVTSWSSGPQPGSWVIEMQTLWAASLMICVNSLASRNCEPHLTTHRQMGWWRGLIKPLYWWLGSWEKTKRLTGQDIWLK